MMNTKIPSVEKQVETLNYRPGGFHPVHLQDQFKKGRYRVIHKLGHGGFATVWLARDSNRNRYVALKILADRLSRDCPEVEILRKLRGGADLKGKGYVMSMLDHFNIKGPNGRHLCIVSEVAGPSIKQCSGGSRRLRASVGRQIALQVTEGLAYIHSTGTVHGDFTTANILVKLANMDEWTEAEINERLGDPETTRLHGLSSSVKNACSPEYTVNAISMRDVDPQWLSDQILIIDFGIAFLQEESSSDIGTPKSYCAPELLFQRPRSASSDIWALGCTLFEIRTGARLFPFKGRPTRTQSLMAMVKVLGNLPEKWWANWEEGKNWYEIQTKPGGDLAEIKQGTLYTDIMNVGRHDAVQSSSPASPKRHSLGKVSESGSVSGTSTTSRMIAIVGQLTTSEVEYVLAEVNKNDPKPSSGSSESNKANSGSSNSKSGEKSSASEGISTARQEEKPDPTAVNEADNQSMIGEDSLARMPLAPVKELPEPSGVPDLLEFPGTKITLAEASSLDDLLRKGMAFLPEDRMDPSDLAKHDWFVHDFEEP